MRANVDNAPLFLQADAEFHAALLTASGNSLFERLSTIIGPVLDMSFKLQAQAAWRFKIGVEEHAAVYEAIARGDPKTARDTMEEIVSTAQDTIDRIMRDRDPSRPS
jgi:DNA-binding FadR family transcriptional regulator